MENVSRLGFGLFKFVTAILNYCNVYKEIKPKREKVEYLENEYNNVCFFKAEQFLIIT